MEIKATIKTKDKTDKKEENNILEVNNLKKHFPVTAGIFSRIVGWVKAVDDVSFYLKEGETLGVVGESGCGKTTIGRTVLRLIEPTDGKIYFKGEDLMGLRGEKLRKFRRNMQIIFQDPYSSLNPRKTVMDIVGESLLVHGVAKGKEREDMVAELLEKVGLSPKYINRYPHEFSGGQRQRIGIARAIALNPSFIVCDEPVSALDVSVQAQVINLLIDLREALNLSYLFIAHGLSVVKHISNRIMVMYLGKMVEVSDAVELFVNPLHPYTKALLSANPVPDPRHKIKRIILEGDVPTPLNPPRGCPFHPRCPEMLPQCSSVVPPLREVGSDHVYVCHREY
ncbi:MAG TPA: dipeptide ABC transporter ATP-binding protein [Candidatus Eremiobacteraeota bacterium]|nr:MAG: Oligopeptide transport ATP-binding protein OppF [bacterium ADurb.Bin363]HPZ09143.1 dipeptide ABC transporter ATP-binding protein [Candidatus Eremiobacteraeota bacterium]